MKRIGLQHAFIIITMLALSNLYALNDLSVRDDDAHPRVEPGFIDEAILVVEPYGAYTEQSLYIKYADHNQFPGCKVLVTHKFELPEGAVVNDLWLWIGDSVMQALILEKKQAQGIWDTITSFKRDPAYLLVEKNQYTLNVYPLMSGNFRKIKMNYVVPTKYIQKKPYVDLAYKFVSADNNPKTPLKVTFRRKEELWGVPAIEEMPALKVSATVDTLGKTYSVLLLPDIKTVAGLTLTYDVNMADGAITSIGKSDTNLYFTFGMYEQDYFKPLFADKKNKKTFIGLDMSGLYGIEPDAFVSDLSAFLTRYLRSNDTMRLVVAGGGVVDTFPSGGWRIVDSANLPHLIAEVKKGKAIAAKKQAVKPRILFADVDEDNGGWRFKGIEKFADTDLVLDKDNGLMKAIPKLNEYDIVTSYRHGYDPALTEKQLDSLKNALDAFLMKGGIFLTLYAYNRDNNHIARRYFKGLQKPERFIPAWVRRNPDGPVGFGFPDAFRYDNGAPLIHCDTGAADELLNEKGQPIVISKKVGNGRFILTSMWHRQDNEGLKRSLCTVLLNLQNQSKHRQLRDILSTMATTYGTESFSEALLMSNSDFFITKDNIKNSLSPLDLNAVCEVAPVKSISLLDGQDYCASLYTIDHNGYYGSAYCLKHISEKTGGSFFSRHIDTWDFISELCAQKNDWQHESFTIDARADGKPVTHEIFKILPNLTVDRAYFFAGKAPLSDSITLSFSVKYKHIDSVFEKTSTFHDGRLDNDQDISLRTMYENEVLKKMLLQSPLDTSAIIKFSIAHRILNDFTAFLALEPNDTNHFIKDPKDEGKIGPATDVTPVMKQNIHKFIFHVFVENGIVRFRFVSGGNGHILVKIFNLSGKTVAENNVQISGRTPAFICYKASLLGNSTYIAVAKFYPSGKGHACGVERTIRTFTITQ